MKNPARLEINLLPKDPFLTSPIGKLLQWALSVGRYLVIFTELIVIMSFATRFSLDRQITDLNSAIHQRQIIIESYGDLEQNVRIVQKKIESYLQVEQQYNLADTFTALSEITPQDVKLDTLQIQQDSVVFSGHTLSNASLNLLVNNIQLSPKFSDVAVDRIKTPNDNKPGYQFQLRAKIRKNSAT